jgi:hypothetical protein
MNGNPHTAFQGFAAPDDPNCSKLIIRRLFILNVFAIENRVKALSRRREARISEFKKNL